jgi:signal transduction histidine kinase
LAVALAILVAALAAWLSLRAVSREVEAARGREEFVAAVTHELKTPLATIRLFAEMLQRGDVEEHKVREFGERTVAQADRLARLVDSVLDLARIEHSAAAQATLDLSALAADALESVERVATQQGFGLSLVDESRSARVRGDGEALVRAVVNLLENALKHSDKPHEIELRLERRGTSQVAIAVLDRGRGVPAAEAQRIFEPFRRVGSELTRDRPGVGLGLALVAKIAAAHGGSASCAAREGGGSCFTIELPLAAEGSS